MPLALAKPAIPEISCTPMPAWPLNFRMPERVLVPSRLSTAPFWLIRLKAWTRPSPVRTRLFGRLMLCPVFGRRCRAAPLVTVITSGWVVSPKAATTPPREEGLSTVIQPCEIVVGPAKVAAFVLGTMSWPVPTLVRAMLGLDEFERRLSVRLQSLVK